MATASEDRCPICLDSWDNVACTVPCLHRFCFGCIQRWAETKPECPLCNRRVTSIRHSLQGDEFEEFPVRPAAASLGSAQDEGPAGLPDVYQPWDPTEGLVGHLRSSSWGYLRRWHRGLLQLMRPWLPQELGRSFGEQCSQALVLERMILGTLPVFSLQEEDLVEVLQPDLQSRTAVLMQGLIEVTMERCGRAALTSLLREGSHTAGGLQDSPGGVLCTAVFLWWPEWSAGAGTRWVAYLKRQQGNLMGQSHSVGFPERAEGCVVTSTSWISLQGGRERSPVPSTSRRGILAPQPAPSSSAAAADADKLPGTSTAAFQEGPGSPCSVPTSIPGEHEELPVGAGGGCGRCPCSQPGQGLLMPEALEPSEEEGQQLPGLCHAGQEATPPVTLESGFGSWGKEGRASSGATRQPPLGPEGSAQHRKPGSARK